MIRILSAEIVTHYATTRTRPPKTIPKECGDCACAAELNQALNDYSAKHVDVVFLKVVAREWSRHAIEPYAARRLAAGR